MGRGSRTSDSRGAARSSTFTSSRPGRWPGARVPAGGQAERLGAAPGGGLQPARGRHRRKVPRQRLHLAPERQVGRRGEAVGAERERDAVVEQRRDVGQAPADVKVRARAENDGRAGLAREPAILGAGTDHVNEQRRRRTVEGPERRQIFDRRLSGHARRRVDAHRRQHRGPGAAAVAEQGDLVLVLGEVDGGGVPLGGSCGEDPPEEVGADGVGGVRRADVPEVGRPGRGGLRALAGGVGERVAGLRLARADELVEEDASHARCADCWRGVEGVADVADGGRAEARGGGRCFPGCRPPGFARRLADLLQEPLRPVDEAAAARNHLRQRRQLQVTVGVHQAGEQGPVSALFGRTGKLGAHRGARSEHSYGAVVLERDRAVGDRRSIDRDDPARADDPHRVTLRRRRAVRSACCVGAARSRPRGCTVRCPRRRA